MDRVALANTCYGAIKAAGWVLENTRRSLIEFRHHSGWPSRRRVFALNRLDDVV